MSCKAAPRLVTSAKQQELKTDGFFVPASRRGPTSCAAAVFVVSIGRRSLRLAPALSAVGFTQESRTYVTTSFLLGRPRDDGLPGSLTTGGRRREDAIPHQQKPDEVSRALEALTQVPKAGGAGGSQEAADRPQAGTAGLNQSVILMTRLGGEWVERKDDHVVEARKGRRVVARGGAGGRAGSGGGVVPNTGGLFSTAFTWKFKSDGSWAGEPWGGVPPTRNTEALMSGSLRALRSREEKTVARLRSFWRKQRDRHGSGGGSGLNGGGARCPARGTGSKKVLLHACAGPGTFRAVREAAAEAGCSPIRPASSRSSSPDAAGGEPEAGDRSGGGKDGQGLEDETGVAGVGCRLPGVTAVALGSLRKHGAYCTVELDLPARASGGVGAGERGWSVGSVKFGRVEVPPPAGGAGGLHVCYS